MVAFVAAAIYVTDVQPKVKDFRSGGDRDPHGPVRSMVTAWRTHRLELDDQTLREWDATVLDAGPDGIVLDRSAFYPGGGGQPPDHGVLLWGGVQTRIEGARKGDDLYLIPAEGDPVPPPGTAVRGAVEDDAAHRAHAHPLRAARALRCGVPRLRLAGHRRQHGAVRRQDGL